MKKILTILLLLISLAARATNYYVKNGGNDLASGLDDANAWATLTKINSTNFSQGDRIAFKRGGEWIGQLSPMGGSVESGTKASPIIFTAYGTGAKPIINVCDVLPGWTVAGNWRLQAANVYAIHFVPSVSRFLVNGAEVRKASSIAAINATNRYYNKASVDSLYFYSTGNPATTYTTMIATYPDIAISSALSLYDDNWVTFSYLDFRGGYSSVSTVRGEGVVLDSCRIGWYSAYFGVTIDGATGNYSNYITVQNCEIDSNCEFEEIFSADYTEDGVSILGGADNVIIENCTVKNWWHSNIYLKNLSASYFNDSITIRYNDISCPDISDGRGLNIDTYGTNSTNVFVYGNYVHDTPVMNQVNCDGIFFSYNIITNVTGCTYEAGVGMGLNVNGYNTSTSPKNGKFYNNIIANCVDDGLVMNHYNGRPHKSNNQFINNIVFNCGGHELDILNNATDTGLYDNVFRNNIFFDSGTTDVISYWNVAMTVAEFEALDGHEGDDMGGNLDDAPMFTGSTFYPSVSSPAINAGLDLQLTTDNVENALVGMPDIGAIEYQFLALPSTGLGWKPKYYKENIKDTLNIEKGWRIKGVPIIISAPDLNHISGVTSNIQGQLNLKLNAAQAGQQIGDTITDRLIAAPIAISRPDSGLITSGGYVSGFDWKNGIENNFIKAAKKYTTVSPVVAVPVNATGSILTGQTLMVDGRAYYQLFYIPEAITVTGVRFVLQAAGDYTADGYNGVKLYRVTSAAAFQRLDSTANDGNFWKGSPVTKNDYAFVGGPRLLEAGLYIVGHIWNASATVTAPTMYTGFANSSAANVMYFGNGGVNQIKLGGYLSAQPDLAVNEVFNDLSSDTGSWGVYLY